jgi:tetratricopeptide (TPR) repeat protein
MGMMARERGEYETAKTYEEEGLVLRRQLGDSAAIAKSIHNLGLIAMALGNRPGAQARFQESLSIRRELGDRAGIADSLTGLAMVAATKGDYALASTLHQEALAHFRDIGDSLGVAWLLPDLGYVTHRQGDPCAAFAYIGESLQHFSAMGNKLGVSYALDTLATLYCLDACREDRVPLPQLQRCVSLWGAAAKLREEIGSSVQPGSHEERERAVGHCRSGLGERAFQQAWEAGRLMTCDVAIAYASNVQGDNGPNARA